MRRTVTMRRSACHAGIQSLVKVQGCCAEPANSLLRRFATLRVTSNAHRTTSSLSLPVTRPPGPLVSRIGSLTPRHAPLGSVLGQLRQYSRRRDQPKKGSPEDLARQVFIRGLPNDMTEATLHRFLLSMPGLSLTAPPLSARVIFKPNDLAAIAYLVFSDPVDAQRCRESVDGLHPEGWDFPLGAFIPSYSTSRGKTPADQRVFVSGLPRNISKMRWFKEHDKDFRAWIQNIGEFESGHIHVHMAKNADGTRKLVRNDSVLSGNAHINMHTAGEATALMEEFRRRFPEGAKFKGHNVKLFPSRTGNFRKLGRSSMDDTDTEGTETDRDMS